MSRLLFLAFYAYIDVNSLERISDFLRIPHEPSPTPQGKPPAYWPASGGLRVEGLSARYSNGRFAVTVI